MRIGSRVIAVILCSGLSAPAFAGDLQTSAAAAMQQQQQATPPTPAGQSHMSKGYLWPGVTLFVGGMVLATYGFLHTSDGDFVEPGDASKLSNPKLGAAGLAIAAGGGTLLIMGNRRTSAMMKVGAHSITIGKVFTW